MRTHLSRRVWVIVVGAIVVAVALMVAAAQVDHIGPRGASQSTGATGMPHARWQPAGPGPLGWMRPMARGGLRGGGTITQISGGTLTLRTQTGTETVTTSGTTQYLKARRSISLADLKVGDVVRVVAAPGAARPATPGTGTVAAQRIVVVEPVLAGRVQSIDGDTVTLVDRDGRLLTVTLIDATTYFTGTQTATRSALAVGSRIVAAGSQDSLTHLTADAVTVLPARPAAGWWGRRHTARPGGVAPAPGSVAPGPGAGGPGGIGA
jgi:Domain of unknown function (DUF5666)